MAQSNGASSLKRMEFEFKGRSYQFTLNPEEYSFSEPNGVTVTNTMAGGFVDSFGMGIQEITLKGITGLKGNGGTHDPNYGFNKFKELRDLIRTTYNNINDGRAVTDDNMLKFYNYTDEDYFFVVVNSFSLSRSKSRPLLFQYDIRMTVIKTINSPIYSTSQEIFDGVLLRPAGNPLSTIIVNSIPQKRLYAQYSPSTNSNTNIVTTGGE